MNSQLFRKPTFLILVALIFLLFSMYFFFMHNVLHSSVSTVPITTNDANQKPEALTLSQIPHASSSPTPQVQHQPCPEIAQPQLSPPSISSIHHQLYCEPHLFDEQKKRWVQRKAIEDIWEKHPGNTNAKAYLKQVRRLPDLMGVSGNELATLFKSSDPDLPVSSGDYVACEHGGRLIYLDIGAHTYTSSIPAFRKEYPAGKHFLIHAWEPYKPHLNTFNTPEAKKLRAKGILHLHIPEAMGTENGTLMFSSAGGMLSNRATYNIKYDKGKDARWKGKQKDEEVPSTDMSSWLRDNVKPEDFVVVKLDVEGSEHEIVPKLVKEGTVSLIDEFYVECHSEKPYRIRDDKTRKDCRDLVQSVRDAGVYAHEWV